MYPLEFCQLNSKKLYNRFQIIVKIILARQTKKTGIITANTKVVRFKVLESQKIFTSSPY